MRGDSVSEIWQDDAVRLEIAEILEGIGMNRGAAILRSRLPSYRELLEQGNGEMLDLMAEIETAQDTIADQGDALDGQAADLRKAADVEKRLRAELANCGATVA